MTNNPSYGWPSKPENWLWGTEICFGVHNQNFNPAINDAELLIEVLLASIYECTCIKQETVEKAVQI